MDPSRTTTASSIRAAGDGSAMIQSTVATSQRERTVLAQVATAGIKGPRRESLEELRRLAESAGAIVVEVCVQTHGKARPSMLMAQGKLDELGELCRTNNADLVIFDNDLTAAQMVNLDLALGVKVIDRTELVLQVFARRARTREAQLQVEIAQLQYLMPRMAVSTKKMSRQRGGIGMRGPGETPLEMHERHLRPRIRHLKVKLQHIAVQHETQTRKRRKLPSLALVGYTNVGKSTLLNALTSAEVYVDDRLFATLDATARPIILPDGRRAIATDTVGFIRGLPHHLIASFRSTLSDVVEADVIVHIADASHEGVHRQIDVVEETLREIGADRPRRILALNKIDLLPDHTLPDDLREAHPGAVAISASKGIGLADLLDAVAAGLPADTDRVAAGRRT